MSAQHQSLPLLRKMVGAAATHARLNFCPLVSTEGAEFMKGYEADAIFRASATHIGAPEAQSLLRLRQVTALFKKNPFILGSSEDERKVNSLRKFWKMQKLNRISTKRLNYYLRRPSRMPTLVAEVLGSAQLELFRLLGSHPSEKDWDSFMSAKVFSSGTSLGLPPFHKGKKDTDAYAKVSPGTKLTASSDCIETFAPILLMGGYGRVVRNRFRTGAGLDLLITESNVMSLQPKDAEIDRTCFTEPSLNSMAQQGIAAMLSPYLLSWGITLHDQSRNAEIAELASLFGFTPEGLATIDLTSASDTVLTALVSWLFPPGWYQLMDAARSKFSNIDGEEHHLSTFSTMGNAFTFPLESLIFMALARACMRLTQSSNSKLCRVYGDDIIIPLSAAALFTEVLKFSGFHVNGAKSFYTGFFRESCGGDFLAGYDVSPVKADGNVSHRTERYSLFNRLQRILPDSPVLLTLYHSIHRPHVGPAIGPDGGETSHLVAPVSYLRKHPRCTVAWDSPVQSYRYSYAAFVGRPRKRKRTNEVAHYLACLAGSYGVRHDLRDTVRYREEVRASTTPWVCAPSSPIWFDPDLAR